MSYPAWSAFRRGRRGIPVNDPLIDWEEVGGGGKGGAAGSAKASNTQPNGATARALTTLSARAGGGNAVVIKIASFGGGKRALQALTAYQAKEEPARDETGLPVDLSRLVADWEKEFSDRSPSRDLIVLRLSLKGQDRVLAAQILETALRTDFGRRDDQGKNARSGAWTIDLDGPDHLSLSFAAILTGERARRPERGSVTHSFGGEGIKAMILDHLIERFREADLELTPREEPNFASGEKGIRHAFLRLQARSPSGLTIASAAALTEMPNGRKDYARGLWRLMQPGSEAEVKQQASIIAKLVNSRQPRDFMHLIVSAPKHADKERFIAAAHDWLKDQFPTHRTISAVHNRAPNKPGATPTHAHVHVAVLLKDRAGLKLDPQKADLHHWRHAFARAARARGLILNPERRIDRLSPPPVKRHEYNLVQRLGPDAPAHLAEKIAAKRADRPTVPKRAEAFAHAYATAEALNRMKEALAGLAANERASIAVRRSAAAALPALEAEQERFASVLGRMPAHTRSVSTLSGSQPMKRDDPITPTMAERARQRIDQTLAKGLSLIADPAARADYVKGAAVVRDLVTTQLDIRAGQRGRTQAERQLRQETALASDRIGGPAKGPQIEASSGRSVVSGTPQPPSRSLGDNGAQKRSASRNSKPAAKDAERSQEAMAPAERERQAATSDVRPSRAPAKDRDRGRGR